MSIDRIWILAQTLMTIVNNYIYFLRGKVLSPIFRIFSRFFSFL